MVKVWGESLNYPAATALFLHPWLIAQLPRLCSVSREDQRMGRDGTQWIWSLTASFLKADEYVWSLPSPSGIVFIRR